MIQNVLAYCTIRTLSRHDQAISTYAIFIRRYHRSKNLWVMKTLYTGWHVLAKIDKHQIWKSIIVIGIKEIVGLQCDQIGWILKSLAISEGLLMFWLNLTYFGNFEMPLNSFSLL